MDEKEFERWLSGKKGDLDRACALALCAGLADEFGGDLQTRGPELGAADAEARGLSIAGGARDCDYRTRGVGSLYTGHWHGKRVHDALAVLFPRAGTLLSVDRRVVDIGAGTGAVLWAWALIWCFARRSKRALPAHRWTNVDSSKSMLDQGERLLAQLALALPTARHAANPVQSICMEWADYDSSDTAPSLVLGSFAFSQGDCRDANGTADRLMAFLARAHASEFVLWTKRSKAVVLESIKERAQRCGWHEESPCDPFQSPLGGEMNQCCAVARERFAAAGLPAPTFVWGGAKTDAKVLRMSRQPLPVAPSR